MIDGIRSELKSGRSPVIGESFDKLSKVYAKKKKGGNRTPNLKLEGDLWRELDSQPTKKGIEVGIFEGPESEKADGHNKFTGRTNNLPKRRFIPKSNQRFDSDIMGGVASVVKKAVTKTKEIKKKKARPESTGVRAEIDLSETLGQDALERELRKRFGG